MKITAHLINQCIRVFPPPDPNAPGVGNVKLRQLVRAAEARYGFLQGPRTVDEFNPDRGIALLRGQFKDRLFIERIVLLRHSILAEAQASTDQIDEFLDDIHAWGSREIGERFDEAGRRDLYLSQVEIQSDVDFGVAFPFKSIAAHIEEKVRSYGGEVGRFALSALSLYFDVTKVNYPRPSVGFQFGRREGSPYDAGLYFSAAPLRTVDHVHVLEQFENIVRGLAGKTGSGAR